MWRKHTFKQTVLFSLILSITFGLFAPTLTVLAVPAVGPGAPGGTSISSSLTPTQSAESWLFYNALTQCIKSQSLNGGLTATDINSGKWFNNGPGGPFGATNPTIGYFLDGANTGLKTATKASNRVVGCGGDTTDWIVAASNLWGYDNPIELFCASGGMRENGSACMSGGNSAYMGDLNNTINKFKTSVRDKIGGDPGAGPSDAARYSINKNSFFAGCLGDNQQNPYTGPFDGFTYLSSNEKLKIVSESGDLTQDFYHGNRKNDNNDAIFYYIDSSGKNVKSTCTKIAKSINQFAAAYQAWIVQNGPDKPSNPTVGPGGTNPDGTTCAIGGIGWIICPVVNFMASIADSAYVFIADNFLSVKVQIFDTSNPTYSAWSIMRSFANVAFVIAFLIIIFSQLTGFGIANYGIKKLLPRIIVAAILVNLSYFICQFAVDLSNILGKSMSDLFVSIAVPSGTQSTGLWSGGSWTNIAGGVLAAAVAGAAIWAALSALIPVLIAAVVALVMVLFILVARQAIIILLIVIAPLAFVAYLLPNTEQLFTKWRKLLTSMLLLYPIVALVYGVSVFASKILNGVLAPPSASLSTRLLGEIAAASVVVLPLFLIPSLLKKSMDGVGNIGKTLNNLGAKGGKALGKRAVSDKNVIGQSLARKDAMANIRRQQKQGGTYKGRSGGRFMRGKYNPLSFRTRAGKAVNAWGLSGAVGDQRAAAGYAATVALEDEENTRAETRLKSMGLSQDETRRLARGEKFKSASGVSLDGRRDMGMRDAATKQMVASNDVEGMKNLWDKSTAAGGGIDDRQRRVFGDSLQASGSRPAYYGQGAIAEMRNNGAGHVSTDATIDKAINAGAYSAEKLASADKDELTQVKDRLYHSTGEIHLGGIAGGAAGAAQIAAAPIQQGRLDTTKQAALYATTDPILRAKLAKNSKEVTDISTMP